LPEKEAGQRIALELVMPELLDSMVLGPGHSVAEVQLPDWLLGRSLADSKLRDRFGVTVLVIKCGDTLIVSPPSAYVFQPGDVLVVIGSASAVSRLTESR
jgi:trk system potassium uptake protein